MKKVLLVLISVLLVLSFIGCTDEDEASYTVSYDGNGLNCDCPTLVKAYTVGDTVTVLDGTPEATKIAQSYHHWTMATNDTGNAYMVGDTFVMPSNHVILHAQYAPPTK